MTLGIRFHESELLQYMSMAGYCAQTNCFIEELTGREMLTLIASLRGVTGNDIKAVVDKWISILGALNSSAEVSMIVKNSH